MYAVGLGAAEIAAKIPKQPLFDADFEVSRGRSDLSEMPAMLEVGYGRSPRRRAFDRQLCAHPGEFSVQAMFSSVQYSFSNDGVNMIETLVLHVREAKDLIQVSREDSASEVAGSRATNAGGEDSVHAHAVRAF